MMRDAIVVQFDAYWADQKFRRSQAAKAKPRAANGAFEPAQPQMDKRPSVDAAHESVQQKAGVSERKARP